MVRLLKLTEVGQVDAQDLEGNGATLSAVSSERTSR